jgi:hypothetical protein
VSCLVVRKFSNRENFEALGPKSVISNKSGLIDAAASSVSRAMMPNELLRPPQALVSWEYHLKSAVCRTQTVLDQPSFR